jgi:hypothetical protein
MHDGLGRMDEFLSPADTAAASSPPASGGFPPGYYVAVATFSKSATVTAIRAKLSSQWMHTWSGAGSTASEYRKPANGLTAEE